MDSVTNHPATQQAKDAAYQAKDTVLNGPVGQSVQAEATKTSNEFSDLADARKTPEHPAATGQPLTHYHSLFYRLLSWKNPRATGITFLLSILVIFASRYLNVLRYVLKGVYSVLGLVAVAEIAGKATLGTGFASQVRPKKYYTIRKESLERFLDDMEQLINFGVIEAQRILFAENIWVTVTAFLSSFISYWLIKWLPLWGLALLGTSTIFLAPLVYVSNKEFIDEHINNAGNLINSQATQVRNLAVEHTSKASETIRNYAGDYSQKASKTAGEYSQIAQKTAGDYTQKAQELIGTARGKANGAQESASHKVSENTPDYPAAPKHEPVASHHESSAPQHEDATSSPPQPATTHEPVLAL